MVKQQKWSVGCAHKPGLTHAPVVVPNQPQVGRTSSKHESIEHDDWWGTQLGSERSYPGSFTIVEDSQLFLSGLTNVGHRGLPAIVT